MPASLSQLFIAVNDDEVFAPDLKLNPVATGNLIDDYLVLFKEPEPIKPATTQVPAVVEQTTPVNHTSTEDRNQRDIYAGLHQQYTAILVENLTPEESRQLRVTLNDGRQYEGFIKALDKKWLDLKSNQPGGEVVRPVQLSSIYTLEVMQ